MASPTGILVGSYSRDLVVVSVLISILASYAALDVARRVAAARNKLRIAWLWGGACAMGTGIWSMHYIGMLAFRLPVTIHYHWPTVALSLLSAVLGSAVALFVVSREQVSLRQAGLGSIVMGGGIAGMHYIGMAAMRLPAQCRYSPGLVLLSVVLAILISSAALLAFKLQEDSIVSGWRKAAAALLMGMAIPAMHYTGMAAARFTATARAPDLAYAIDISLFGTAGIVAVTMILLGLTLVATVVDRRFAAQSLALEFERRYRHLVETAQVILWRRNPESPVFSFINQEAESLLGYPLEQWLTRPEFWLEHCHPEDRVLVETSCRRAAESGEPQDFEHRIMTSSGKAHWLRSSIRAGADQAQNRELYGVMVDINERRRAQEAAEAAAQAKRQFLNNMSHELRTPMNGMLGMAQLMSSLELSQEHREYLNELTMSAEALLTIISDILDFSQAEAGVLSIRQVDFRPRDILQSTLQAFASAASRKGLKLRSEIDLEVPDTLRGDPLRVRQILINLVGNALKFTERGEVSVGITLESGDGEGVTLRFKVRDTGIGIPREKQQLIFEPFTQVDGSDRRRFGGAGLGLTVCRRLVELLGGSLGVESTPGKGSEFQFTVRFAGSREMGKRQLSAAGH